MIIDISSDEENDTEPINHHGTRGRRNIRAVKKFNDLSLLTKAAHFDEYEKESRIKIRLEEINNYFSKDDLENQLILDFDDGTKLSSVVVHESLFKFLKNHQKKGIRFMWNSCFESVSRSRNYPGHGCILAHCMGLGKTLQVVTLCHTILSNSLVNCTKVLILCPKNTVLNWVKEFSKWIKPPAVSVNVFNPTRYESYRERMSELNMWSKLGGACIMNYDLFRTLLGNGNKENDLIYKILINPGADLVICDEGHILKNAFTKIAKVMFKIKTARRIVLTGTPLQNNLMEYFTLVSFIRPNLLGTADEFRNMFTNPIQNGQFEDSLPDDVKLMKERSHVLHKTLIGSIQRYDYTTLASFLPEKYEFVLTLRLTQNQIDMYLYVLAKFIGADDSAKQIRLLFRDYQLLQRIWTHPYSLKLYDELTTFADKVNDKKSNEDFDEEETLARPSRLPFDWWREYTSTDHLNDYRSSAKVAILFEIIQQCAILQEKMLVFSGSLFSLHMIEHFLIEASKRDDGTLTGPYTTWERDEDYIVLTGKTSGPDRDKMCEKFNDENNPRCRLFLISTRAGGIGINLTAANRSVIFDASWNPSYDTQSIFRIYRLGQTKPCYVYRLIASGTMEEKIYERQVTKDSTSHRVVDEKQIARHYSLAELKELYELDSDKFYEQSPLQVQDRILSALSTKYDAWIGCIHEHDSLLKHKLDEELRDAEKQVAWSGFADGNNGLSEKDMKLIHSITPDKFRPSTFKQVLRQKYPQATESVITDMLTSLMPRIKSILQKPNFRELLLEQAVASSKLPDDDVSYSRRLQNKRPRSKLPIPVRSWGVIGGVQYGDDSDNSD